MCHNNFGIRIGGVHREAGCERRVDGSNGSGTQPSLCKGGRGGI